MRETQGATPPRTDSAPHDTPPHETPPHETPPHEATPHEATPHDAPPRRHPIAPLAAPFVHLAIRMRIPATAITLASVPLGILAFLFLALGFYWPALIAVIAAGSADAVDGEVARRTGRTSRAGGYLDSLTDRLVDALILVGLAWGVDETRSWIAALAALFGALTTSAAKWRAAEILRIPDSVWGRDFVERTDRFLLILLGIALTALLPASMTPPLVFGLLVILASLTNLTVAQRILKAWRLLKAEDAAAAAIPMPSDPPAGTLDPKD